MDLSDRLASGDGVRTQPLSCRTRRLECGVEWVGAQLLPYTCTLEHDGKCKISPGGIFTHK